MPKILTGPKQIAFGEDTTAILSTFVEPSLWHQITEAVNFDNIYTYEILEWIVEQPECDIATAYSLLARTGGYELIYRAHEPFQLELYELVEIITERSQKGLYSRSEIGLHGVHPSPTKLAQTIKDECSKLEDPKSPYLPVPTLLLDHSYPDLGELKTGYMGDETGIWDIKSITPEREWHYFAAYFDDDEPLTN